jgi:hypothetical protein
LVLVVLVLLQATTTAQTAPLHLLGRWSQRLAVVEVERHLALARLGITAVMEGRAVALLAQDFLLRMQVVLGLAVRATTAGTVASVQAYRVVPVVVVLQQQAQTV